MNAREIDDLLGTPARLAVVATLAQVEALTFTELGQQTGLADGNLHVQTRKLAAAGYLDRSKGHKGKRPITLFALTDLGRGRFRDHVRKLADAAGIGIYGTEGGLPRVRRARKKDDSRVW